jgi:hypothetical protein
MPSTETSKNWQKVTSVEVGFELDLQPRKPLTMKSETNRKIISKENTLLQQPPNISKNIIKSSDE